MHIHGAIYVVLRLYYDHGMFASVCSFYFELGRDVIVTGIGIRFQIGFAMEIYYEINGNESENGNGNYLIGIGGNGSIKCIPVHLYRVYVVRQQQVKATTSGDRASRYLPVIGKSPTFYRGQIVSSSLLINMLTTVNTTCAFIIHTCR